MQEEDQADAQRDGDLEDRTGFSRRRQDGRQHNHAQDEQDVDVGLQPRQPAADRRRAHASTRKDSCRSVSALRPSAISRSRSRVG